jgi:uncharacterized cupredoxin-like copper-binding protein
MTQFPSMRFTLFSATLLCGLVVVAVGGSVAASGSDATTMTGTDMKAMPADHHHHATSYDFGEPFHGAKVARTVAITMGDASFAPDHVDVKQGEAVRFVVTNASSIDHDFTLGDPATQTAHRREMAEAMQAGREPHHHDGGNAITVKPGATLQLAWRFTKPGNVEYDCNVPGHFEAGMTGTVAVSP